MKISLPFASPLIALLVVAGCGGHDHHGSTDGGTTFATDIKLTVGTGYNGSSVDLTGTPTLNPTAAIIEVVLNQTVNGTVRDFIFTVPASSLSAGSVLTPANAGFGYGELSSDGVGHKDWTATAGSVTITSIANGKANVTVNGLQFTPSTDVGNNAAAGSFTANGKVIGIPVPG